MRTLWLLLALFVVASTCDAQQIFTRTRVKTDSLNYGSTVPIGPVKDSVSARLPLRGGSLTGLLTLDTTGIRFALHTIKAGDSVFGHVILHKTDSTLKVWNGTAWVTLLDMTP